MDALPRHDLVGQRCDAASGLCASLCATTAILIGLTWPLWVDSTPFPRIPFLAGWRVPLLVSWPLFVTTLATVLLSIPQRLARCCLPVSIILLAALILGDQGRLQPWAYQYILVGIALTTRPHLTAIRLARLVVVGMYIHSGISKLDISFATELGPLFLHTGLRLIGLLPRGTAPHFRLWEVLALPLFELLVGMLLALRKTRFAGFLGSSVMHMAIIGILSPMGLDHSLGVLAWNAGLVFQNAYLFRRDDSKTSWSEVFQNAPLRSSLLVAAIILPTGERAGLWDTWPSFAVYASHNERVEIWINGDDAKEAPKEIGGQLLYTPQGDMARLDITGWSRGVRGAPPYPQIRTGIGVAEWVAARMPRPDSVRVVCLGRADWLSGQRDREVFAGRRAIVRHADRFWLNARPADIEIEGGWRGGRQRPSWLERPGRDVKE